MVEIWVRISERRALAAYDPANRDCDPSVREEIDAIGRADGLIVVIDSQAARAEANIAAFSELKRDLTLVGGDAASKPMVFQANKRDLPDVVSMEWVREHFRTERCAYVESEATQHKGTLEAMREVLRLTGALE